MVLVHMVLAVAAVKIATVYHLMFDFQIAILVSPIVFPLAFAINTDFRRRDTVLEKISHFESSGMVLYMCLREWRKDTGLNTEWINSVHDKLKSLLFLLREYLFTDEAEKREYIMRALYEDFSDISQTIDQMRTSRIMAAGPLTSRAIHLLSLMCLSFEQLRVVKEYRSPRSIRAFNKVLIMLLPIILAPYFVYHAKLNAKQNEWVNNEWAPYFISVVVAFVFSALQGVQDKLDDPFDGMGEDDIKLNAIDDWTFKMFGATVQRFNFNASIRKKATQFSRRMSLMRRDNTMHKGNSTKGNMKKMSRNLSIASLGIPTSLPVGAVGAASTYQNALRNMKSNTCVKTQNARRISCAQNECADVFDCFDSLKSETTTPPILQREKRSLRTSSLDEISEVPQQKCDNYFPIYSSSADVASSGIGYLACQEYSDDSRLEKHGSTDSNFRADERIGSFNIEMKHVEQSQEVIKKPLSRSHSDRSHVIIPIEEEEGYEIDSEIDVTDNHQGGSNSELMFSKTNDIRNNRYKYDEAGSTSR